MADQALIHTRAVHAIAINDLLTRFFQSFDEKDWDLMRSCLAREVFTDYSSFRGTPAATITGDAFVEQRRTALSTLDMQHNFSNLRVEVDPAAGTAAARCNYVIYRFLPRQADYFHSYGRYAFTLTQDRGAWQISGITQVLLRNEGNPEIHSGVRKDAADS